MDEIITKLAYVAAYGIKLAFISQGLKTLDEICGESPGVCRWAIALSMMQVG